MMHRIESVTFGLLDTETISRMCVCEVTSYETLRSDGRPVKNGVLDPRMGLDHQGTCATCNQPSLECLGHYGYITMHPNYPLYNMMFKIPLLKLMNVLCAGCGHLPIAVDVAETTVRGLKGIGGRLSAMHKACTGIKECASCGDTRVSVVTWQNFRLVRAQTVPDVQTSVITALQAYTMLSRVRADECALLGFSGNHPRDLMNTLVVVVPPCARPGVLIDEYRAEDDITVKYIDMVKTLHALTEAHENGHPGHVLEDLHAQLQMHWSTLQRNDTGSSMTKGGRPTKSIYDRNTGKQGRMRVNIQGKRVNNSARTVISGDPNLQIDEVGIPMSIASILTVNEVVNDINLLKMQALVDDERVNFLHQNGRIYDTSVKRRSGQSIKLGIGDRVERHLINGDWVLFNRQPTLHRQGLMAMRTRILPEGSTFRMNLAVTTGYNADFDGDEMNCFLPLGIEALAEAATLMSAEKHVVSAATSKPIIAIIQDCLLMSNVMSEEAVVFERAAFFQLCCQLRSPFERIPPPALLDPPRWTGKQALSMCLPAGFSLDTPDCCIKDGHFVRGSYNKKILGTSRGGIVHMLHLHAGSASVSRFLDDQQLIATEFAMQHGASVGIGDMIVPRETIERLDAVIAQTRAQITDLIARDDSASEELHPRIEQRVNALLNACRDQAGHLAQQGLDARSNNMLKMIASGSKGSAINIAQIAGCVGQQNVDGARIAPQFDGRTLPHFTRGDFSDIARGFISSSYLTGLAPAECFFHAKAGREGLCDTALRTAESGYMQRRCIKSMEDIKVEFDGTVRDSDGRVLQFAYGEDNMDAIRLERIALVPYEVSLFEWPDVDAHAHAEALRAEQVAIRADAPAVEALIRAHGAYAMLPVDVLHELRAARSKHGGDRSRTPPPASIAVMTNELVERIERVPGGMSVVLRYHLRTRLASKVLCAEGISIEALGFALKRIELATIGARVHPGEAVGIIAAQSLGEPMTQSTLNTFHFTGVSAMRTTTQGLPRFREILGATENPATPIIIAPLLRDADVRRVQRRLDYMRVGDLVLNSTWVVEAAVVQTVIERATETTTIDKKSPLPPAPGALGVHIELDRLLLRNRAFVTDAGTAVDPVCYVAWRIETMLDVFCVADDANVARPHVYVFARPGTVLNASPALLERAVLGIALHGSEGVTDVRRQVRDRDGEVVLEMLGASILRVMGEVGVDGTRVTSNHVREVWRTLGVEAARATLVTEMKATIEGGGSGIDVRHIMLVAELMTLGGEVAAVSRYGTNRCGRGPITRASFEQTVEVFADAAMRNSVDLIGGVSDRIFLGQRTRMGTGSVECMLDTRLFEQLMVNADDDDDDAVFSEAMDRRSYDPFEELGGLLSDPFERGRTPQWSPGPDAEYSYSPAAPAGFPGNYGNYSPVAGGYSPGEFSPTSPRYSPTSPEYNAESPWSPTSPTYVPDAEDDEEDDANLYEPAVPMGMLRSDDPFAV